MRIISRLTGQLDLFKPVALHLLLWSAV